MTLHFDGATYDENQDSKRLGKQLLSVRDLMMDGRWRTLRQIADATDKPEASLSARLRDLRKPKFGSYVVQRKRIDGGLYAYRVLPPGTPKDLPVDQGPPDPPVQAQVEIATSLF